MGGIIMIYAATSNYPNSAYPNRLPNQSLRQRSKQVSRPIITKPPTTNPQDGWKQAREQQNQHYRRQNLWQEEAQESGLILLTTNKGDLVYNSRGWCIHGQSSTYSHLKKTNAAVSSVAKSLNVDNFPTELDHINPKCFRKLVNLDANESRVVAVHKIFNRLKQKVNSKIYVRKIQDYNNLSVAEIHCENLERVEGKLWNSFYKDTPNNLAYQNLIDSNLDLLAINGYELNRPFALAEIQSFTQNLQIEDGQDAAKITFVLRRLVVQLEELPNIIRKKACFNEKNRYLVPISIIDSTESIFISMSRAILSVERSLSLTSVSKAILRKIVKESLDYIKVSCIQACNYYLEQWKMQPGFPKKDLKSLEKKLNNENFAKSHKPGYLDSLSELYNDPFFTKLQIQNLSFKQQFEEFTVYNRASSEIFEAWDEDPYKYVHTPVKLDVGGERIPSIKEGPTEAFKSKLDEIIITVNETIKLASNADSMNNQVEILSQKWQFTKNTDDIFLPLISQFKNEKNDFSLSKPEMEARLAAWQQARSLYLKAFNESREVNTELQNISKATYDIYAKALSSLNEELEKNVQLTQQNQVNEIEKLQHIIDDASRLIIEIHDFCNTNLAAIQAIDTPSDDVIEFASESNQAYDAIESAGQPDSSPIIFEAGDSTMPAM